MDPLEREFIADFYTRQLRMHGDRPEALHWTLDGQMMRFNAIFNLLKPENGSTILDYGCGKGDFYGYMLRRGVRPSSYTGADITPGFIEMAQRKYPGCDFQLQDVEEGPVKGGPFDYTVVCGVFNNRMPGARQSLYNSLSLLFRQTRGRLVFNGLSSRAVEKHFEINYTDPGDILDYALGKITPNASVYENIIMDDIFLVLDR